VNTIHVDTVSRNHIYLNNDSMNLFSNKDILLLNNFVVHSVYYCHLRNSDIHCPIHETMDEINHYNKLYVVENQDHMSLSTTKSKNNSNFNIFLSTDDHSPINHVKQLIFAVHHSCSIGFNCRSQ
jgi:hypothetical protein